MNNQIFYNFTHIFWLTLRLFKFPFPDRLSVKSVRIRSYFGLYFPAFGLNTDQNSSKYGHFLHSYYDKDNFWNSIGLLFFSWD